MEKIEKPLYDKETVEMTPLSFFKIIKFTLDSTENKFFVSLQLRFRFRHF